MAPFKSLQGCSSLSLQKLLCLKAQIHVGKESQSQLAGQSGKWQKQSSNFPGATPDQMYSITTKKKKAVSVLHLTV